MYERTGWLTMFMALWMVPGAAEAQSWRDLTLSRQIETVRPLEVEVAYGAGRFVLESTADPLLYRMNLHYDEDAFEPVAELTGTRLKLGTEGQGGRISLKGVRGEGSMDLVLGRGVPMDLDLRFGAVQAEVDLGGLSLTGLELSTGASESTIDVSEPNPSQLERAEFEVGAADFTLRRIGNLGAERINLQAGVGQITLWLDGEWRTDTRLAIEMGLGALELRVPEGLGLRVRKDSFLTAFDSQGLVKRGDAYYSLDWDRARYKVTVDLDAAFGSVDVVWIR